MMAGGTNGSGVLFQQWVPPHPPIPATEHGFLQTKPSHRQGGGGICQFYLRALGPATWFLAEALIGGIVASGGNILDTCRGDTGIQELEGEGGGL